MKISVIIPCFNNQDTIIETINSVLSQNKSSFEIIVVDDGSTDHTKTILKPYIDNHQIKYIYQANAGPSKARNKGAGIAQGAYLLFLDADDKIATNFIEEHLAVFDKNPNLNLVYCDAMFFGSKKGLWKLPNYNFSNFLHQNVIPIFAMTPTNIFKQHNGFDENISYTEDWELWIRILSQNKNAVYKINKALYYYRKRINKSSLTDNKINEEKSLLYIYHKHYDLFVENKLGLVELFRSVKYQKDYYNKPYRKLFYTYLKKKKK